MPISKHKTTHQQKGSSTMLLFVLVISTFITTWFSQNSIKAYWQQTYHTTSPIAQLDRFQWWRAGGALQSEVNEKYQQLLAALTAVNDSWQAHWAQSRSAENAETSQHNDETNSSTASLEQESPSHSTVDEHGEESETAKDNKHINNKAAATTVVESENHAPAESNIKLKTHPNEQPTQAVVNEILNEEPQLVLQSAPAKHDAKTTIEQQSNDGINSVNDAHHSAAIAQSTETKTTTSSDTKATEPTANNATPVLKYKPIKRIVMPTRKRMPDAFDIRSGETVFFAGDSLMQGVAPHVQKWLKSEYNIASINLSKQSTGLSYPNFFDWPAIIEKQLRQDPSIKLLIVFLGPNDPWDIPNPAKPGGKYLKFRSPEWANVYNQRIKRILDAAKAADVDVIWLGVPRMKKSKLDEQMIYLNELLHKTLRGKAIWLPTDNLLSGDQPKYRDSIEIAGESTRVRSKDGIHFTISGQKYLAEYIERHIRFKAKE